MGRCSFINPAALAMLGLTEEQALGADAHALFHHSHVDGLAYDKASCPAHPDLAGRPAQTVRGLVLAPEWARLSGGHDRHPAAGRWCDTGRGGGVQGYFRKPGRSACPPRQPPETEQLHRCLARYCGHQGRSEPLATGQPRRRVQRWRSMVVTGWAKTTSSWHSFDRLFTPFTKRPNAATNTPGTAPPWP
jgi:PAS domain-containing protein